MKIIYDNEQPQNKRITVIGKDGKPYYGFRCFQIQLDDGKEIIKVGLWGDRKKREAILRQHRIGWDKFLDIYPHLRGRIDRARNLAGKLELEFKADQRSVENKPARSALENLVNEAMEA